MTDTDQEWSLCNSGPDTLRVWLEPWCDEFEVPARSVLTLQTPGGAQGHGPGEIEWGPDNLVLWATGPIVTVFIDDERQESASAKVPIPDGLTRTMLALLFDDHPVARLGGRPFATAAAPASWWRRVKSLFGRYAATGG